MQKKRKLKPEDLYFLQNEQTFNENQEPDLYNLKEHLSKLKFNFGELESKKRFLEQLKSLEVTVHVDMEKDYEELKQKKDMLKEQKKVNGDVKDKIKELVKDLGDKYETSKTKNAYYEEKFEEFNRLLGEEENMDHEIQTLEAVLHQKNREKEHILSEITNLNSLEQKTDQKLKTKNAPSQKEQDLFKILTFLDGIQVLEYSEDEGKLHFSVSSQTKKTSLWIVLLDDEIKHIEWDAPTDHLEMISKHALEINDFDFLIREIHGLHFE